jgi:Fe-S-cluster-containing dehydrogenase component
MTSSFEYWHGKPRSDIDWQPYIDTKKCTGCGMCVVTCSEKRNVFGYDLKEKKAVILYPENCMVGCNNCQVGCLWDAITFPDIKSVKDVSKDIQENKVFKEELEKKIGIRR